MPKKRLSKLTGKALLIFVAILAPFIFSAPTVAFAALTDNLVSYWKLDESSGNATDAHGSNTLTNNGTTPYVAAKINNGADFGTPSDSRSLTSSSASLYVSDSFSFSFWVKAVSVDGTNPGLINRGRNSDGGYQIWRGQTGLVAIRYANSSNTGNVLKAFATSISDGSNFKHIVIVFRVAAGEVDMYIDGTLSETLTGFATTIRNAATGFEIMGNQSGDLGYGNGVMDEVGFWDKALTSTEVTSLYNGGAGLVYPFAAPPAPTTTDWIPHFFGTENATGTISTNCDYYSPVNVGSTTLFASSSCRTYNGGPNFQEWLAVESVIIILLGLMAWGRVFGGFNPK